LEAVSGGPGSLNPQPVLRAGCRRQIKIRYRARVPKPRIALSAAALSASIAAALALTEFSGDLDALRGVRQHWHEVGYGLIAFFLIAVLLGTSLHTASAAAAGLPVGRGWRNAGLLVAYGIGIAAVAGLLAPAVADDFSDGRFDVDALYPTWLVCALGPFAVLACTGGLFPRPRRERDDPLDFSLRRTAVAPAAPTGRLDRAVLTTGVWSWAVGALPLVFLVIVAAIRLAS
jgi:hypothetical protein